MAGIKETRHQVQKSGSPLKRHSLNQRKLKTGNEGQNRYEAKNPLIIEKLSGEIDLKETVLEELREENLPLSQEFLDEMLPFMVDTAIRRAEAHLFPASYIYNCL